MLGTQEEQTQPQTEQERTEAQKKAAELAKKKEAEAEALRCQQRKRELEERERAEKEKQLKVAKVTPGPNESVTLAMTEQWKVEINLEGQIKCIGLEKNRKISPKTILFTYHEAIVEESSSVPSGAPCFVFNSIKSPVVHVTQLGVQNVKTLEQLVAQKKEKLVFYNHAEVLDTKMPGKKLTPKKSNVCFQPKPEMPWHFAKVPGLTK